MSREGHGIPMDLPGVRNPRKLTATLTDWVSVMLLVIGIVIFILGVLLGRWAERNKPDV